jgi:hypothetical protein
MNCQYYAQLSEQAFEKLLKVAKTSDHGALAYLMNQDGTVSENSCDRGDLLC